MLLTVIVSIFTSVFGGIVVEVLKYFFTKKK